MYIEELNLLKEKIRNDDGIISKDDVVFCSEQSLEEISLIKDKILEFYDYEFKRSAYQNNATVYMTDVNVLELDKIIYDSELNFAVYHNQRVITFNKFSEAVHSKLVIIDQRMYDNLTEMLKSKDLDTLTLACELISNSNRTDPESINYVIKLVKNLNVSLFSGIQKSELLAKSSNFLELLNFLEREHYDDYTSY